MPESDEAVLLQRRARRRLIGAIALVVFVVIALPMVFDKEPKPITHDLAIRIPSQDTPFKPNPAPEAVAPKSEAPAHEAAAEPQKSAGEPADTGPDAKQPAPQAEPEPDKPAPPAFMVPLGAYSNAANAKQVRERVAAAGYKTTSEKIKGPRGDQVRVRAGPFASREAAERAREKLKGLGLNPVGAVAAREQP